MFLSLCILKSLKPLDYYKLHKDLWRLFPKFTTLSHKDKKSPFFYRVENPHEKNYKRILMQSTVEPVIQDKAFPKEKLNLMQTKPLGKSLENLQAGQELQFFVRAYPSKRLKKEGKSSNRGKVRVPLRKDLLNKKTKDQVMLEWLKNIMEKENYVSVKNCQIVESFPLRFKKKQNGKYHYGAIYTVSFKGYLKLNKPKDFIEHIILHGIGPGKAFGCGMLSIAKD